MQFPVILNSNTFLSVPNSQKGVETLYVLRRWCRSQAIAKMQISIHGKHSARGV